MGASVIIYWPDMSEDQLDSQPGFFNDCKAWGNWMAEREDHRDVLEALRSLGVAALLSYKTDGIDDGEVDWVAPADLEAAAQRLRALVLADDPGTTRIVETYSLSANHVNPVREELARDLADIAEMAQFAQREEARRVTLEVNW